MEIKTNSQVQVIDRIRIRANTHSGSDSVGSVLEILKGENTTGTVLNPSALFDLQEMINKRVQQVENQLDPSLVKKLRDKIDD